MSAQEAGSRSGLGWVILVAALAVPGFLFYNWSSRLKADHDKSLTAKARGRLPDGGVFQTPPAASARLVNPIAPSTAPVGGAAPAGMKPPMAAPAAPALPPPPLPGMRAPAGAPAAAASAAAPLGGAAASASTAAKPAGVTTSTAAAVDLPRDPLISPLDIVRIREAEEEAERQRRLALMKSEPRRTVRAPKPVERKIDDDVELQGIVTSSDGRPLAIVNDETLGAGQAFTLPGHPGQVKIVSISADTVVFVYKNKRFKKVVTTE